MTETTHQFVMASIRKQGQIDGTRSVINPALSSSPISSPRIYNMMQRRSVFASQREFEIEASKDHWSELESEIVAPQASAPVDDKVSKKQQFICFQILGCFRRTLGRLLFCWQCAKCGAFICGVLSCGVFKSSQQQHQANSLECVELEEPEDSDVEESNREIFESIKKQWGGFFSEKWGDNLELGPKIAEGGQAEIFEVEGGIDAIRMEFVVKAYKKGYSLRSLQTQWPLGALDSPFNLVNSAIIFAGTVLQDDRFAFVMYKYWGDLRKLIDLKMEQRNNIGPPFQEPQAISIMWQIANGMEQLHKKKVLHRDLKASNVLVASDVRKRNPIDPTQASDFACAIADYECSVGVVGTGFWRAPGILAAVRDRNYNNPSTFTEKADVYSFAMTCYEILTECMPFEALKANEYDVVLSGQRPQLPHPMNSRVTELLCRCWHSNPSERPRFEEIVLTLETIKRSSDLSVGSSNTSSKSP